MTVLHEQEGTENYWRKHAQYQQAQSSKSLRLLSVVPPNPPCSMSFAVNIYTAFVPSTKNDRRLDSNALAVPPDSSPRKEKKATRR